MPMLVSLICGALIAAPLSQNQTDLKLSDLFPKKGLFGKTARQMSWSHDDRYLAYLWNAFDDKGYDLWVYDTREGKSRHLTDIQLMSHFDRELPAVIARYKKDKEEDERRKKLTDEERKKLEDEDDKKEEERREQEKKMDGPIPIHDYLGISGFSWANKSDEILFEYRGDIFRIDLNSGAKPTSKEFTTPLPRGVAKEPMPTRLTKTQEYESGTKWLKDDTGFFFRRGTGVFRIHFDSPMIEQLNPPLPKNMTMGGYSISPDESKMMITSGRSAGSSRQVTYISYRDRFATARTAEREVADDAFTGEQYMFLYDLNDDPDKNPKNDGKPWQIFYWPAGQEWGQSSVNEEPWSKDSKQFVFATWKRTKKDLDIIVADMATKTLTTVYHTAHSGGHTTPGMTSPFFTEDGKKIITLLETSGYRHAWVIDPITKGATQLTRGDFEVYPEKLSKDGKSFFATSWKEHSTRMDLFSVDVNDGSMKRLDSRTGAYSSPEISHENKKLAANFSSWSDLNELYVLDGNRESKVTDSHPDSFAKINKIRPQSFEYMNRHGQAVHGYIYYPPNWNKADKRPLMIYVYGGPLGTSKDVVDGKFNNFNMYLAYTMGYVTVDIDPRGMSGYGAAFEAANFGAPGVAQVEDLTDGVKWLLANAGVDPKKVGINGWSFGGFQTQMCMYTAPDVFTLGIAGAGPTEWQNYNNWYSGGVIGESRLGKPEDLDKYSLTKLAKNLKGHLMLLHGMEDTNVLFQDTIHVYQALLRAGKGPLVELVIDPTGGHGLGGDIKTKDRYEIYEAYLRRIWGPYVPGHG